MEELAHESYAARQCQEAARAFAAGMSVSLLAFLDLLLCM